VYDPAADRDTDEDSGKWVFGTGGAQEKGDNPHGKDLDCSREAEARCGTRAEQVKTVEDSALVIMHCVTGVMQCGGTKDDEFGTLSAREWHDSAS
jgi:hypothetical protein